MVELVLDVETTTFAKGNPFSVCNHLVCVGLKQSNVNIVAVEWTYPELSSTSESLIQHELDVSDVLVGFNIKFDLHWLKNYGFQFDTKRIWDCQVAQFIIQHQKHRYPSLNSSCEFFGLEQKLDKVKEEYWDKGVDTHEIPRDVLAEYLCQDLKLTEELYRAQLEYLKDKPNMKKLILLHCKDLLGLQEMEFNGLAFDETLAKEKATELSARIHDIDRHLNQLAGRNDLNYSSGEHISALLFGGTILFKESEPYEWTYKSGQKKGLTATRYKHHVRKVTLDRRIDPLENTGLVKEGFWSTDEQHLRQLKAKREVSELISLLLERARLEKLVSTYYEGFCKLRESMDWPEGRLHGQFNQCVAVTGRLSSSNPNLQNMTKEVYELMYTDYA